MNVNQTVIVSNFGGFGFLGPFWGVPFLFRPWFFTPIWFFNPFLFAFPWIVPPIVPWWAPPPPPAQSTVIPHRDATAVSFSEMWPIALFDVARVHLTQRFNQVGEAVDIFGTSVVVDNLLITFKVDSIATNLPPFLSTHFQPLCHGWLHHQVWDCALRDGFESNQPKEFASLAAALITFRYDDASSFSAAKRWIKASRALGEKEVAAQRCFTLCLVAIKSTSGGMREVDPCDAAEFASSEGLLILEVTESRESLERLMTTLGER